MQRVMPCHQIGLGCATDPAPRRAPRCNIAPGAFATANRVHPELGLQDLGAQVTAIAHERVHERGQQVHDALMQGASEDNEDELVQGHTRAGGIVSVSSGDEDDSNDEVTPLQAPALQDVAQQTHPRNLAALQAPAPQDDPQPKSVGSAAAVQTGAPASSCVPHFYPSASMASSNAGVQLVLMPVSA